MPERDVFSRLLLHRSAMIDHLPSSYVRVLGELRESYQQLPGQLSQGRQQQQP
jgi:hypothetical protein